MKNFLMGLLVISMGVLILWGFSGQYHINCDSEGNCTYHETKDYPKKSPLIITVFSFVMVMSYYAMILLQGRALKVINIKY